MKTLPVFVLLALLFSCRSVTSDRYDEIDDWNRHACNSRYSNLDTCLFYATNALEASSSYPYPDGQMYAHVNLAFVAFQQMNYEKSIEELSHVFGHSKNQIELLSADVMAMKVYQRTGRGRQFFDHRHSALKRLSRIDEEYSILSENQRNRVEYARAALHLICSTYYYYMGQYDTSEDELQAIDKNILTKVDTSLFLNYNYLLGTCQPVQSDTLSSFFNCYDILIQVFAESRRLHNLYFEGNSLQSLANLLCDTSFCRRVEEERSFSFHILQSLHADTLSSFSANTFSLTLAQEAVRIFREYGDIYQTTCAIRTLGDMYFRLGDYSSAHSSYLLVQDMLDAHSSPDTTVVLPGSILLAERLSRSFSAIGEKELSHVYRNQYLDYLDHTRQDLELDSRRASLLSNLRSIRFRLIVLVVLLGLCFLLARHLSHRVSRKSDRNRDQVRDFCQHPAYLAQRKFFDACQEESDDRLSELEEEIGTVRLSLENEMEAYIERRSKVAVVKSVLPFLDRMLDTIRRLPESSQKEDQFTYLKELSNGLVDIHSLLTQWIPLRQGNVKMHVTVFPVQSLLDTLSLAQSSFLQKGIQLVLDKTEEKVRADKALTLFMLNTLVDNASKFTPSGGLVHVEVQNTDSYVELSIQDSGVGLSETDVDTINNSKIYDPEKIGSTAGHKGFGFGILNCKGIIQHYRKSSSLFSVCDFGVSSRIGEGSRFWFRLPRVLSMLLFFLCPLMASSQNIQEQYENLFQSNLEGRYAEGLEYGEKALALSDSCRDTLLLMNLHNEMAIAALSLQEWDTYTLHNAECLRLHRLYTQDFSLASDCARMQRYKTNGRVLYVLLVLVAVFAAFLFYILFLRDSIHNNRCIQNLLDLFCRMCSAVQVKESLSARQDALASLHGEAQLILPQSGELCEVEKSIYTELSKALERQADSEEQYLLSVDQRERISFEYNRLYIQNQILDNCLSTIKHETMYYPARVLQIVERMQKESASDITELSDFVCYYRSVYGILCEQAQQQLQPIHFPRQEVSVPDFVKGCELEIQNRYQKISPEATFHLGDVDSLIVFSDPFWLRLLVMHLLHSTFETPCRVALSVRAEDSFAKFRLSIEGIPEPVDVDTFFDPLPERIPYLVARQILRDHDALSGHPGLRLTVEELPEGYQIEFTLKTKQVA